jgi:hypothetical protein
MYLYEIKWFYYKGVRAGDSYLIRPTAQRLTMKTVQIRNFSANRIVKIEMAQAIIWDWKEEAYNFTVPESRLVSMSGRVVVGQE